MCFLFFKDNLFLKRSNSFDQGGPAARSGTEFTWSPQAPVKNLTEWDWTLKLAFRWRKKMAADSRYSGIWNVIIVNDCTERKTD